MTEETFKQSANQPVTLPMPFGKNGSVTMPSDNEAATDMVNYTTGIPSAFSSPGTYIKRAQMNGAINSCSREGFFNQMGGYRTYDPAVAAKCGGYPRGIVLKYFYMGMMYDVMSLVDNNTWNFVEKGINPSYWKWVTPGTSAIPDWNTNATDLATTASLPTSFGAVSAMIEMPFDGFIKCNISSISTALPVTTVGVMTGITEVNGAIQSVTKNMISIVSAVGILQAKFEVCVVIAPPSVTSIVMSGNIPQNGVLFGVASGGASVNASEQPIPVAKGYKIQMFGMQNFTNQWPTHDNILEAGTFSGTFNLVAYPMVSGTTADEEED